MAAAHASVGAASTPPTPGTIFSPADATRHGAASNPHPDTDVTNGRIANKAHHRRSVRGAGFEIDSASPAPEAPGLRSSNASAQGCETVMAGGRIGDSIVIGGVS